jgi:hypothetical protein
MSSADHKAPHYVVFHLLLAHPYWAQITQLIETQTRLFGTTYENSNGFAI